LEEAQPESILHKALFPLLVLFALLTSRISPAYIVAGLLLLGWFLDMARRRSWSPALASPLFFAAGLIALFTALSTAFSRDPRTSVTHLAGVSLFFLIPITIDLVDRPSRARTIFLALAAATVLLSLVGFWEYAHGGADMENRITGTLSHYMTFSGLSMIASCILLGFLFEGPGRWRWAGALCVLPLTAMVLTFTRNAYVGTLAAIVAYLAVRRPRGLLVLAPLLAVVFLALPAPIRARVVSIGSLEERTNKDRIAMAHAGFRMIGESPVFGIGPEMVRRYYPLYRDRDAPQWIVPHLHDNVLQIAAASGLFAAAAYLAFMGLFFIRVFTDLHRRARSDPSPILAGALMAGVALFVAGFFEYNFGDTEVEMATLLVMAVPFAPGVFR
jgi:O-antigen ligase